MRYTLFISLFFLTLTDLSAADKLVRCKGRYLHTYSTAISLDIAKVQALNFAITEAIAEKLGRTVSANILLQMSNTKESSFDQISQLTVKGEWVKDIQEPKFEPPVYKDNQFGMWVTVDFYARPLELVPVTFTAYVLRNGTDDSKFKVGEIGEFNDGDQLFVSFQAPRDGYVAIYLQDTETAICALPYIGQDETPFRVKKGQRYIFLTEDNNRYHMTCEAEPEINFVHIIFSPFPFFKGDLIREMPNRTFRKWLGAIGYDSEKQVQVQSKIIKVSPQLTDY